MLNKKLKTLDLFSGCGGLTLGFKLAGFESQLAVEFVKEAAETFKTNLGTEVIVKDIRKVSNREISSKLKTKIDLIAGGPPCEGFSNAGKRNPLDKRNLLYREILRIARYLKPKIILMENVPALLTMKNGDVINDIRKGLLRIGYQSDFVTLNSADFGVPQNRRRLFIIATKDNNYKRIISDLKKKKAKKLTSVYDAISDLPSLNPGQQETNYFSKPIARYQIKMRKHSKELLNHKAVKHRQEIIERYKYIKPGSGIKEAWQTIPQQFRPKALYAARGRRLHYLNPSYTVTSHCLDELIHPEQNRAITPREAARLQSFPDWYRFLGKYVVFHGSHEQDQYEQIGDAVPPLMAEGIAKVIKRYYT